MKKAALACLYVLLCLYIPGLATQEAPDLTAQCRIEVDAKGFTKERVLDRDWETYWKSDGGRKWMEIQAPADCFGLYISWTDPPPNWKIEERKNGQWTPLAQFEASDIVHQYYPLNGVRHIRLSPVKNGNRFGIEELFVLGQGDLPGYVQQWQKPDGECDLLLLTAHPDDEVLFFGGLLPTYAGEQKKDVVVAVLTDSTRTRRSELLNSLWTCGVRNYPVIGRFDDKHSKKLETAYAYFGQQKVYAFVTALLRQYKPKVVVTHDLGGEYAHGMHKMCADACLACVPQTGDANQFPKSAQAWGAWQVQKLYLHLYDQKTLEMDWDRPLPAFGGQTGFEVAQQAYLQHASQQHIKKFQVEPRTSPYSSYRFGLAYTSVGDDVQKDDLFENVQ